MVYRFLQEVYNAFEVTAVQIKSNKNVTTEVIESPDTLAGTIDKLCQQNGPCIDRDGNNEQIIFHCNRKGVFGVSSERTDDTYVIGEVKEENGKTLVYIRCVYSAFNNHYELFALVGIMIPIIAAIILCIVKGITITGDLMFGAVAYLALAVVAFFTIKRSNKHRTGDLEKKRDAVIRRVEAIKRWND